MGFPWAAGFAWCVVDASVDGFGGTVARWWIEGLSGEKDGGKDGWATGHNAECQGDEGG